MSKHPTTVRLDDRLRKDVQREAKKAGLSVSGVIHLLLLAFSQGELEIGVTQYSKGYLQTLGKEADQLRASHRKGKAKSYASSKALFDDILDR